MTNKKNELKRTLNILLALYYVVKIVAVSAGLAAALFLFIGFAGDTVTTYFFSFLGAKGNCLILGLCLAFLSFITTKLYKHIDPSLYFLEVEKAELDEAEAKECFLKNLESLHLQ